MSDYILTPFLNRAGEFNPADWFHLVAKGDHPLTIKPSKAGDKPRRVIQRVDDASCAAIVGAFTNRKASDAGFRLLVDFEHFSHNNEKASEAAAWITAMENRADGVWFQADWSDLGETAIKNRRYRSISPVWFPAQCQLISEGVYRPLQVNDAGLTNKANLQGLVPFWNRAESLSAQPGENPTTNKMNPKIIKLLAALGVTLAADATPEAIETALDQAITKSGEAAALQNRLSSLNNEHTALRNRHTTLLTESVTRELESNQDVIPEGQKDAWKNRLESDFAGTSELLRGLKRPEGGKKTPLHQAGAAAAAAAKKNGGEEEGDPFMNRVKAVRAERKLDESEAIAAVAGEEPALYEAYREAMFSGE